jgi:hypothetical protein
MPPKAKGGNKKGKKSGKASEPSLDSLGTPGTPKRKPNEPLLPAEGVMQMICIESNRQNILRYKQEISKGKENFKSLYKQHTEILRELYQATKRSQADADHMSLQYEKKLELG